MNNDRSPASRFDDIKAARMLLEKMGINPADLLRAPADSAGAPTFADYIPRVSGAVSSGTRRVYGSYWNRVVQEWGPRPITDVTASDIGQLAEHVKATVVTRRNARGGRGAAEHLIAALRCLYKHAVADGILTDHDNPAARVPKPRRLRSARTALPDGRLEEILRVAATTGDDPLLDALLLRLHTETACRRGGALALRTDDLRCRALPDPAARKGRDGALAARITRARSATLPCARRRPDPCPSVTSKTLRLRLVVLGQYPPVRRSAVGSDGSPPRDDIEQRG